MLYVNSATSPIRPPYGDTSSWPLRMTTQPARPSVSETIDWARTLVLLGIEHIDAQQAKETLHILLKYQTDIAKAAKELAVEARG